MKRPRTIFGPFVFAAVLLIGYAIGRYDRAPTPTSTVMEAPEREFAQLTRKGRARSAPAQDQMQSILGARVMIPVEGVTRRDLQDTWGDARSEGRSHEGIDIMAPQGTRVQAVANGRIVKFFNSERGGVTVYQFDQSERYVYYYAHLSARAAGLVEGDQIRQGATIGYVGMSGNAPVPHLHFEIQRLGAERRWWEATSVNPYPYLMSGAPPA
jgi:murein DD-endopeptidase MepM/ murein hydrolase activator NlpD